MAWLLLLVGILIGLALMWLVLVAYRRSMNRQLQQVTVQLERIAAVDSKERVTLMTSQTDMRLMLQAINALIDYHEQTSTVFVKMEHEMRRMLSNVSHDLKTPLTVIRGYIEMLQQSDHEQADRDRWLASIARKASDMGILLDSFFDLAKLESGDTRVELHAMRLNDCCRQVVLAFYDRVITQGLQMEIEVPSEPLHVRANEQAVSRVLHNLLENALRYGNGGQRIGLKLSEVSGQACIEVWDEGKGIAEPLWERVFDRLYTLDDARNAEFEGSGLGLTIAKHLTEAMEGTIRLQSIPHTRTSFFVILPLMSSEA